MTVLLTDDEVVALSFHNRTAWPAPLPSIALAEGELARAQQSGARSLVVRGLLDVSAAEPAYAPGLAETVLAASESPRWVASYVASLAAPTRLAGDATYVFESGDDAVVDVVSAAGIHQLTSGPIADARRLVVASARNVFDFGIAHDTDQAGLFVGSNQSTEWTLVRKGSITRGSFAGDGSFAESSSVTAWDESLVDVG